ncbi:MAG: hypothetical protein AAFV53_19550 [Myxococcota bacterium]
MIGLFLVHTALAAPPMMPTGDAPSAAALAANAVLFGVGASLNTLDGDTTFGGAMSVRGAPIRRLQLSAEIEQGAAWLSCPTCGGTTTVAAARYNVIETDALCLGGYGMADALIARSLTGQLAAGISAEGGVGPVRADVTVPVWSSTDLLERMLYLPEAGLTVRLSDHHATRLSARGVQFRPAVSYQYSRNEGWLEVTAHSPEAGGVAVRAQIGVHL